MLDYSFISRGLHKNIKSEKLVKIKQGKTKQAKYKDQKMCEITYEIINNDILLYNVNKN